MSPVSVAAQETARRIWVANVGDADPGNNVATTASELFTRLEYGLGQWLGANGYRGVLERAVGESRELHPWTSGLESAGSQDRVMRAAAVALGGGATIDGIIAVLAAIIDLLSRIVGDVVAARLVEKAGVPVLREVTATSMELEPDE